MLLFEAENHIKSRMCPSDYENMPGNVIDQMQADVIAMQCINAQIRLAELLNSFFDDLSEEDSFSVDLVYEILSGIRFDAKFDEDGMFIPFEEDDD